MTLCNHFQLSYLTCILLLLEGFFSGSEIALLSSDKLLLKRQSNSGHFGSKLALRLVSRPEHIFSITLFITSICVTTLSTLITFDVVKHFEHHPELFATLLISPLVVFFGELIPKIIFQKNADTLASKVAYPIYFAYYLFFPITKPISIYTTKLSKIISPAEELMFSKIKNTRENIRELLTYAKNETEISPTEKKMIHRIFNFRNTEVKHALIPLVQVNAIDEGSTVQEALEHFEQHRHSRMPVYQDRVDNIIGILKITDLLLAEDLKQPIRHLTSNVHYVAKTQSLKDLISEMQSQRTEMAVVVDEHGGAIGILTLEDILEEIVGEISDEDDHESDLYHQISNHQWLVQARMEIQQINEVLKLELPTGHYETLSGFLLQQFGRIPKPQDELHITTHSGQLKFLIQKATQRQIETVLIEKLKSA